MHGIYPYDTVEFKCLDCGAETEEKYRDATWRCRLCGSDQTTDISGEDEYDHEAAIRNGD